MTKSTLLDHTNWSLPHSVHIRFPQIYERHPLAVYIRLLGSTPTYSHYHKITENVSAIWQDILSNEGEEGLEEYNRVTMLQLIEDFKINGASFDCTPSVIEQFHENFDRIKHNIENRESGTYIHTSDNFLKDFAICRQKVFPVRGAQIVEIYSGLQRSILFTGGIKQFFRYLFMLLFVTRGRRPIYRTHTHLSRIKDFTAEGRDHCFLQIAGMLERHPNVKGWCGGSWLYDPALGKISPKLGDLCARPAENGGWVFYDGEDQSGGAIAKSAIRQKLFAEGKYKPKNYTVVWPRKKLIAWKMTMKGSSPPTSGDVTGSGVDL